MRDIKFRAWDKELEIMIYSDGKTRDEYQCCYDFIVGNSGGIVCIWSEDYDDSCGYPSTRSGELDNLMQYTGLKDKNGVDIFEGDICRNCYGDIIEIKWISDKKCCGFNMTLNQCSTREVIGNIHQNPNLLAEGGE